MRKWFVKATAWAMVALALVCGLTSMLGGSPDLASSLSSEPRRVVYSVQGTAKSVDVTYNNAQGGTEQKTIDVPWTQEHQMKRGAFAYISAQNNGETGTVVVRISVDGEEWRKSEAEGAYKIADASGSVE